MDAQPDDVELWEIDENFARAELTPAQRADHHASREEILVRKGVVNTRGGDRKSKSQNDTLISYAEQAAKTLGVSEATVNRELARGKKIKRQNVVWSILCRAGGRGPRCEKKSDKMSE